MFNGMFGKIEPGMCRLSMNGNIAVKTAHGYKTYNVKKGTLTNVTNFCFNIADEFFFLIPTNKVAVGDIILVDGKPKCVIAMDGKIITAIDYESSEIRQILPERHVFMGSSYFYGKIVSMFGENFKTGKGLGGMMKMMMMSQVFGGGNGFSGNGAGMGNFGQMMAMSMFMNGKDNPFDGMFDSLSFDAHDDDEEVESEKDEE